MEPVAIDPGLVMPTWHFEPLILVVFGILYYFYRSSNPVSQKTIDELNEKSFWGMAGSNYTAKSGIYMLVAGLVLFFVFNFDMIRSLFR